jgi:hypothetical protein
MMIVMKLVLGLLLGAAVLSAAGLSEIKTVYVFPMRNSLDQYLVSRLTQTHTLQVVSDPKLADAVFTDSVGPTFESAFNQQVLDGKPDTIQMPHAFRSSRSTVFLVSKGKRVIWSIYLAPKDATPRQLEKASNRLVASLQKDLGIGPALHASSSR